MSSVHLVVPGLLGPAPAGAPEGLRLPLLERLLSRSEGTDFEAAGVEESLLAVTGVRRAPGADAPLGALALLGEGRDPGRACWMRATPVYLRADLDRLLVLDTAGSPPDRAEADALVASFNRHFADQGLCLEAPRPERWYLRLPACPDLQTRPLAEVLGRAVGEPVAGGKDAGRWRALLNETQMLFHEAEGNRVREGRGLPLINGLWLDGAGVLPATPDRPPSAIQGGGPLVQGLARLAGAECGTLPERVERLPPGASRVLVLYDRLAVPLRMGDGALWAQELRRLQSWLEPLLAQLRRTAGSELMLYPADGRRFRVDARALRRFWRRRRSFGQWLARWV